MTALTGETQSQALLYGSIPLEKYPKGARKKIIESFGLPDSNPKAQLERQKYWENYAKLGTFLEENVNSPIDIVQKVKNFFLDDPEQKFAFAKKQLTEKPPNGLGIHLSEVKGFTQKLLFNPSTQEARFNKHVEDSDQPFLSERQSLLMVHVAAEMHDMLKFLGTPDSQVMPDHEVVTAELIRRYFTGQRVDIGDGKSLSLSTEDVEFLAQLVADHENITKEARRDEFPARNNQIDHSKSLFFIIDTLTNALDISERNEVSLNGKEFRNRFIDLFQRHFDHRPPQSAKIFRPMWGLYALRDYRAGFQAMEKLGFSFEDGVENFIKKMAVEMLDTLSEVLDRETTAKNSDTERFSSDEELSEMERVKLLYQEVIHSPPKVSGILIPPYTSKYLEGIHEISYQQERLAEWKKEKGGVFTRNELREAQRRILKGTLTL